MKTDELKTILEYHKLWLRSEGGKRADLSGADLRSADLRSAVLSGADLSGADLRSAVLSGADLSGADLSGAVLSGAVLSGADLSGAVLRSADLSGAVLSESSGIEYAQCSWTGHGERGRQLSAVRIAGEIVLFCGCFRGSVEKLEKYIANGDEKHRASRTRAMQFVMESFV